MIDALVMNLPLKFVSHKIEEYAMQVTYDPRNGTGRFVYNLSLIDTKDLEKAIAVYKDAFKAGVCVSGLVRFVPGGEEVGDFPVPEGKTGIVTVCSTTLDGILIHRGVPLNPIGGGVVEIEQRIPRRFTHPGKSTIYGHCCAGWNESDGGRQGSRDRGYYPRNKGAA